MQLSPLTAISPLDGRYRSVVAHLANYFSEQALIRYRVLVEVRYLRFLAANRFFQLSPSVDATLTNLESGFSAADAEEVKRLEKTTAHDVKAVEYLIKEKLRQAGGEAVVEWVHFGLTSQDINNTAVPLIWKDCLQEVYLPQLDGVIKKVSDLAQQWKTVPMLARTHGQPASPTQLGKELQVFVERLHNAKALLTSVPTTVKFGGATGNFNAHRVAFPGHDWIEFGNRFTTEALSLQRQQFTTQIEHYDNLAAAFDAMKRINTILLDLCRDVWTYISMDYFTQTVKAGEVGSSAMPHKVNPIDFENAEGNIGLANALFEHLSAKLPVSRLQRDLTDSTVLRNIGVPVGHTLIAFTAIQKGAAKLVLNKAKLDSDLEDNWAVVAEAFQTILRREQYPNPYEALKDLTRGTQKMSEEVLHQFIDRLQVADAIKAELKAISPHNYTGITPNF